MASSTSSSGRSSSSSYSNSKWRYDVFLSFRGEDTRNTFTDHLYWALDRGNIKTFRDDEELPRGEEISPQLLKAIEGSRIAIVVFSKTYADSKWCLDELVKIMECEKEKGQKVFPIFYHVEPSEVRNQTGIYGEAFNNHERNADGEKKKKIEEWKAALRKAGKLSGFPLQDGSESNFIEEIIGEIRRLIPKLVHVGENIVGIDENLTAVKLLIDAHSNEVSMVGIYGIGGIGKTTIAKVIYNDMLDQFKRHSFLENVRERSKDDRDLLQLQEELLCDIQMVKNLKLRNVHDGTEMIKSECHIEKVLIVLDDVDCPKKLKFLAPNSEWFHQGSIIIVTTRNKRCLDVHKAYLSYEAKGLVYDQAKELFSWNAFQQHHPKDNYMDLCNRILYYAKGHPLTLVVLGSFLFQRGEDEWESTLYKLKTTPLEDIQKVLRISYDGLDDTCKKLFLDIACFFNGCDENFVTRILEGCKFHPKIGLRILDERCLISISVGLIRMHDLLQEMGWAIVREKHPENPGKWSRLWQYEDITSVLTNNMETKNIEGIFLNESKPIRLSAKAFKKMNRLRLLKVRFNVLLLSEDFDLPSRELTYFDWNGYPLESMPSIFHANNLVKLHLSFSNIRHLWEGNMYAGKLKVIDLRWSKHLVDISSLSGAPNLEILNLEGCVRLKRLPRNLHKFKRLQTLYCADCFEIKSFPEMKENIGSLRNLDFSSTGIIEVPSSIRHLHVLEALNLNYCRNLLTVSDSIYSLSSLKTLLLVGCLGLKGFPNTNIESLKSLKSLNLLGCLKLESLPMSICKLSSLQTLNVKGCRKLEAILVMNLNVYIEGSLRSFDMTCHIQKSGVIWSNGCFSSLKTLNPWCNEREEEILNQICPLSSLVELSITKSFPFKNKIRSDCYSILSLEILSLRNFHMLKGGILSDIFHLSSLKNLSISNCNLMEEGIPSDTWNLSSLRKLFLRNCNLMGGGIVNHICHLSSLRELDLQGSHFSSIHAGLYQLSNLRILNLSHCRSLQQIPELPSSLRIFDAHGSESISSTPSFLKFHSLVNWFKSGLNQVFELYLFGFHAYDPGISIVIPRSSGILYGMSYQSTGSDEVRIQLPPNWYANNDLLGFALWCVYVASPNGSQFYESAHTFENETNIGSGYESEKEETLKFRCDFKIQGNDKKQVLDSYSYGSSCAHDGLSDIAWLMCYPKVAIRQCYGSNEWTHFVASFRGNRRVEGCGIRLIYAKDYEQKHLSSSSFNANFGDHGSPTEDDYSKAHNKRSPIEQSPVDESHHKRFRRTQD